MQIDVPDDIVRRAEVNAGDLRTALAVQLYADNRIDHADACCLAGISDSQLDRELLSRALSVQQYRVWSSRGPRRSAG